MNAEHRHYWGETTEVHGLEVENRGSGDEVADLLRAATRLAEERRPAWAMLQFESDDETYSLMLTFGECCG